MRWKYQASSPVVFARREAAEERLGYLQRRLGQALPYHLHRRCQFLLHFLEEALMRRLLVKEWTARSDAIQSILASRLRK